MVEPVPTQTADKVAEAIKELRHLVTCRCEPPWTERDMHNTTCVSEYADDLDVVEAAFGLVRTQVIAEALDAVSVYRDQVLGKLDTSQPTQRALHGLANEWLTGARSAVFGLADPA